MCRVLPLLLALFAAGPALAVTYQFSTPIAGDSVLVTLELESAAGGTEIRVSLPPGAGDLLGVFGNAAPESLLAGIDVSDPNVVVTQWQIGPANKVWKVGSGNVMTPVKTWDWGVRLGFPGCGGGGPVESASFVLEGVSIAELTGAATQSWVFGVRIQATGGPEGSAKIGMPVGTPPLDPPPAVEIATPGDGALLGTPAVTVGGSVSAGASVTVNGEAATVTGTTWSATLTLGDGLQTVTAVATNAAGSATDSVAVTIDTTPPVVVIAAPPDGALTTQAAILVEGSVNDASPIGTFSINGQTVALGAGNAFSATAPLALGANAITASATDAAGNTGSASVTVTRGEPPAASITSPGGGFLTNQGLAVVTGTVTASASVSVNGVAAMVTGATFSASVPLVEGANTITATATSPFGAGQDAVTGTRDSTPPVVTISAPIDGSETSEATVFVAGTVADASPIAALAIDGDPITPGNSFNVSAGLAEGVNTITVTATDAAGNAGTASVTVTRHAAEPLAVAITSPPDGSRVSQGRIAVAGTVSPAGVSVVVNGVQATVTGESFTAAAVPLEEGPNTLTATATSGSATASDSAGVTLNLPPEIAITSPLDGAVLRAATANVEGLVNDPLSLVDVNGISARVDSGGRFVAEDVPLDVGPNDLVARAIDLEGAQASDRAAVTRDDAGGPAVRVVAGFFYNFEPWPTSPFNLLGDPDTRLIAFATTDEWLAAMAQLGRPASGFQPAADLPVVRGAADSVLVFVLSEDSSEPTLDVVFPDGHASDYITSDYQGGGPASELFAHPLFEFFPPERVVNRAALAPSDIETGYYHFFLLTRPVEQPDDPDYVPPHSAPLVIRASRARARTRSPCSGTRPTWSRRSRRPAPTHASRAPPLPRAARLSTSMRSAPSPIA